MKNPLRFGLLVALWAGIVGLFSRLAIWAIRHIAGTGAHGTLADIELALLVLILTVALGFLALMRQNENRNKP